MAITNISSTIQIRRDSYLNFMAVDPILKAGEMCITLPQGEAPDNVNHSFELRCGTGLLKFSELPVLNSIGGGGSTEVKVDSKSIIMNAAGEVALNGFADAAVNYIPYKNSDGELGWMPIPTGEGDGSDLAELVTKIDSNTGRIEELETKLDALQRDLIENYYNKTEIDQKVTSVYKPGETYPDIDSLPDPSEDDEGVVHPVIKGGETDEKFVNPGVTIPDGSKVVVVKMPDGSFKYDVLPAGDYDLSDLIERVEKNELDIAENAKNIGQNQTDIDNVRTNLLNNYYTKPEIDEKLGAIYHPAPGVDEITDLPDPDTLEPGTTIVVEKGGTTTEKFVEPGTEIPDGSTVVVVTDPETGEKKYDVLPPATQPDLSQYATKEDVANLEDMTVKGVSANGTPLVRDTNGIVDIPVGTLQRLGLVRSSQDDNKIAIKTDGSMEINSVSVEKLYVPEDSELVLDGGSANS